MADAGNREDGGGSRNADGGAAAGPDAASAGPDAGDADASAVDAAQAGDAGAAVDATAAGDAGDGADATAPNQDPSAGDDTATTAEDSAVTVAVLDNDTDADADALVITAVSTPQHGTASIDGDDVVYTPAEDFNGSDDFTYDVSDGAGGTATATVSVTVTAVPDAPTAAADAYATDEDQLLEVDTAAGVLGNDGDRDGDVLTAVLVDDVSHGTLALAADGSFTYQPVDDYYGADSFTYRASDGSLDSSVVTVDLDVMPVNDGPTFAPGASQSVLEDAGPQSVAGWASAIAVGPANEAGQTAGFTVSNDNAALFAVEPALAADGTLTFTPADDLNGSATVMVAVVDDGGTDRGGVDTSAIETFTITVAAVNDAPSIVGADVAVDEDKGAVTLAGWAGTISPGPSDETGQTVTLQLSSDNAALFAVQPALASDGTLSFTTADDAHGSATLTVTSTDDGGTDNGGVDTAVQTFTLTVAPINDAPSFTGGNDVTVAEDSGAYVEGAWATALSAGPVDEASQALSFAVQNDNPALFAEAPAVSVAGELTFTPADDAFGSAQVTVVIVDDGGTSNGGVDQSAPQTFTITVEPVNDEPSFTVGTSQVVFEDIGPQSLVGWIDAASAGPANEASQTLSYVLSNDDNSLFAVQPSISSDGTLSYTPADDANGSTAVHVRLRDDGGTALGGDDESPEQTFTITITPVNDPPSFTASDVNVVEDAGPQSLPGWVTAADPGPPDEAGQTLSYAVTTSDDAMFASTPMVSSSGELSFQVADDAYGAVTITVTPADDGGTSNGGNDTGAGQSFTLTVLPVNDEPSFVVGPDQTVAEDAGPQSISDWAQAVSAGPPNEQASQSLTFLATNDDNALFAAQPAVAADGTLTFTPADNAHGSTTVHVRLRDDGGTALGGDDESPESTFTITIDPVDDDPVAGPDAATTTEDLPIDIDVLANDADVDGDALSIASVGGAANGTVMSDGNTVTYIPDMDYVGPDSFTYELSDGTAPTVTGTVDVTVDPDPGPPVFVFSTPATGDLVSLAEGFAPGNQLAPARFVFDDPLLDGSAASIAVWADGGLLVEDTDYTRDVSVPGEIRIVLSESALTPTSPAGDLLEFELTGITDINGNAGDPVNVSIVYDDQPPMAYLVELGGDPAMRIVLGFSEPMDPTKKTDFVVTDVDTSLPVTVEPDAGGYLGSAFVTYDGPDDLFYFVPRDLVPRDHEIAYDASAFCDAAGNPLGGGDIALSTVIGSSAPIPPPTVYFVDPGETDLGTATLVVTPAEMDDGRFTAPNAIDGGAYDVVMVFDRELSPSGFVTLFDEGAADGGETTGVFETTSVPNDSVRFPSSGTFDGGDLFHIEAHVYSPSVPGELETNGLWFTVQRSDDDGVAPTIIAVAAQRGASTTPVIRRGEPFVVAFSERLDLTSLGGAAAELSSASGTVAVRLEMDDDRGLDAFEAVPIDGSGSPVLLDPGLHTLTVTGATDLSDPPRIAGPLSVDIEVVPLPTAAPALTQSSPADGSDQHGPSSRLFLGFSDTMDPTSFVDTGDPATRGFRFEEQWVGTAGSFYMPRKGLATDEGWGYRPSALVGLRIPYEGLREETTYRVTAMSPHNLDGVPLAAPATFTFSTASTSAVAHRPRIRYLSATIEVFPEGTFTFMGGALPSNADLDIELDDVDGADWFADWEHRVTTVTKSSAGSSEPRVAVSLTGVDMDELLLDGDNPTTATARDSSAPTALSTSLDLELFRYSGSTEAAAPAVTDLGGGRYTISGDVTDTSDGIATRSAEVIVLEADVSGPVPDVTGFALRALAQIDRDTTGALTYSYTMPPDVALPSLASPMAYIAIVQLEAPSRTGVGGTLVIPVASAPFNPP